MGWRCLMVVQGRSLSTARLVMVGVIIILMYLTSYTFVRESREDYTQVTRKQKLSLTLHENNSTSSSHASSLSGNSSNLSPSSHSLRLDGNTPRAENSVSYYRLSGSILILKTARTGSTWLCHELNRKGFHVSQESMLNWRPQANNLNLNPLSYTDSLSNNLSTIPRGLWVYQSLIRPMAKTPFAVELSCVSNRRFKSPKPAICNALFRSKSLQNPKNLSSAPLQQCLPPFTSIACNDSVGCFQQEVYQMSCFRITQSQHLPLVTGLSYNYRSSLRGLGLWRTQGEKEAEKLIYRTIFRQFSRSSEDRERELVVVAQTRSNIVRWRVSQAIQRYKRGVEKQRGIQIIDREEKRIKLHIFDAVGFFTSKSGAQNALNNLLFTLSIDSTALCVFYENLARNITQVVSSLQQQFSYPREHWQYTSPVPPKTKGQNHPNESNLRHYISNYEEVELALREYPCYHKQLLDPRKDNTWTLPISKLSKGKGDTPLAWEVDHMADCFILDERFDSSLFRVQEYLNFNKNGPHNMRDYP
ncbi:hypothetical protein AAMO2058_001076200 [Amorphochlora amoebiformis]